MSLPEPSRPRRAVCAFALLAAVSLGLAACGFQPLYSTTGSGARLAEVMAGVDITPIPGRVGQQLRNELIFLNTGGGHAANSQYRLDIAVRESVSDQMVQRSGYVTGQVFELNASFKLVRLSDNQVVLEGGALGRAPYDRVESVYANLRARRNAEDRAATTVADSIRTRIAAFLSGAA
jgi:LPS-assembly lipoprotein